VTTSDTREVPGGLDPAHYREVMGHYPTGVAVVTGTSPEGEPVGMVVGTFTAVSLDPPLVAFMPTTTSGTYALMRDSPSFCVNVLAHDQLELCRLMAVPRPGKFDEVGWRPSPLGAPVLDDAVAHIHCRRQEEVAAGDHYIVLCAVEGMEVARPVTPLLFFQGGYGGFNPRGMTARADGDLIAAVRLAEVARPHIERLARTIGCETGVLVAVDDHEMTSALSAFGGSAEMQEPLGERVPLMPPLGEAYVAFQPPEVGERWVSSASSREEEVHEKYRRRLADVRARGYALSVISADSPYSYDDLKAAMREYASGGLTPARERAVRAVISQTSPFFETVDVDDDHVYDLGSIVVPVFGPGGHAAMVLRARQLPQGMPGSVVRRWVDDLKQAAAAVAEQLGHGSHERYEAYLDALPGDYMM
jgi:flavin reductase (DIM6/NTAB) family NADH-FMN oxidoreductase RutF/DNA-binding IclR family transcriptional regulator